MSVPAESVVAKRFEKSPGNPLLVHFHESVPYVFLRDFRRTVMRGGGVIEQNKGDADVIVIGRDGLHVYQSYKRDPTVKVVDLGWVHRTGDPAENMPLPKPKRGPANAFNKTEEEHLAMYLARRLPEIAQGGRSGLKVYGELLAQEAAHLYPWACHHSAESWRSLYRNKKQAMDARIERIVMRNPGFLNSKLRMRFSRIERHKGKTLFDAPDKEVSGAEEENDAAEGEQPDATVEGPRDESPIDHDSSRSSSPMLARDKGKARAEDMLTQRTDVTLVNPSQRDALYLPNPADELVSTRQYRRSRPSTSQLRASSERPQARTVSSTPSWMDLSVAAGSSRQSIPAKSFKQPVKAFPGPSQSARSSSRPGPTPSAPRRILEDSDEESSQEAVDFLDSDDQRREKVLKEAKRPYDSVEQEPILPRLGSGVPTKKPRVDRQGRSVKPLSNIPAGTSHVSLQRQHAVQTPVFNPPKRHHALRSPASSDNTRSRSSVLPQTVPPARANVVAYSPAGSLTYNRLPTHLRTLGGVGDADPYARYDALVAATLRQFEQKYGFVPKEIIQQYEDAGEDLGETEERLKRNRDTIMNVDLDSEASARVSAESLETFTPAPGTKAWQMRQTMDASRS